MEIWKLTTLMFTMLALVYSVQGLSFTVNREHWISDNGGDEPVDERLASQVAGLLKRSKSDQFYGLMGKRSDKAKSFEILQPVRMDRRRHKGDMFVGLMGKRSFIGPVTRTIPETSTEMDKSADLNKQSADLQEEWDKLQYY
ncbi:protachykinin-1 isoform X1 [Myxocyprinus asiaticus]|uniref:protachykinin-1 isoform X1 n=1 Tax=Myxocyprinus asiaticus TaxID=70543 RepID=UPI0022222D19|nr:protachykinin-1 isoform X1 [Myxocyprinus asiaticus]